VIRESRSRPERPRLNRRPPHAAIFLDVLREVIGLSRDRSVTIDALSNALKPQGFRRPPESARLITPLR